MKNIFGSWHVGVAAEAYAAGLFARCGIDVSVQYGANQPEYDLVIVRGDKERTIFCLVQFKGITLEEHPRVYLATPMEIAQQLKETANGRGDSILYEEHHWGLRAYGAGTAEQIPPEWLFSLERVEQLLG